MTLPSNIRISPQLRSKLADLDQLEKKAQQLSAERRRVNSAAWQLRAQIIDLLRTRS